MSQLGFIITRHVNNEKTNLYWIECISQIRKFYPKNTIIIIDDNSDYRYIHNTTVNMDNIILIQSEYPKRGELLPYYYFHKYKLFDKAVIIHDSVFIQKFIDFQDIYNVRFLWEFDSIKKENIHKELDMIRKLNFSEELERLYHQPNLWQGCFGAMSVIEYDFLDILFSKYNLTVLLDHIHCRVDRSCFERIFAIVCNNEYKYLKYNISFFKNIKRYIEWGYPFEHYNYDKNNNNLQDRHLIKVWTGR